MKYSLLKSFLSGTWHIHVNTYLENMPILENMLKHGMDLEMEKPNVISVLHSNDNSKNEDVIAIHRLEGVMTLDDQWCGYRGTKTVMNAMLEADEDPSVIAHIMNINSGGGQSISIDPFEEHFSKLTKPVYASVDYMAASAAYGIASFAKEIYAEQAHAIVGSIGTMISFAGFPANAQSSEGLRYVRLYASKSTEKNGTFEKALNGDYAPLIQKDLDPTNERFLAMIKRNRSVITEEFLDGTDTEASNAIGTLVDGVMSLNALIEKVFSENKTNKTMELKNVNQALGVSALVFDNEGYTTLSMEQMEALENAITDGKSVLEVKNPRNDLLSDLQSKLNQLSEKVNVLESKNEELKKENEELINQPQEPQKPVQKLTDSVSSGEPLKPKGEGFDPEMVANLGKKYAHLFGRK
jgi:ClpP class serine protease